MRYFEDIMSEQLAIDSFPLLMLLLQKKTSRLSSNWGELNENGKNHTLNNVQKKSADELQRSLIGSCKSKERILFIWV